MARKKEQKYLSFPEIQADINQQIKDYRYKFEVSYAEIARRIGVPKSRLSELKKQTGGVYLAILTERILSPLVREGVAHVDHLIDKLDVTGPNFDVKRKYHEDVGNLRKIELLKKGGYPIDEHLNNLLKMANIKDDDSPDQD